MVMSSDVCWILLMMFNEWNYPLSWSILIYSLECHAIRCISCALPSCYVCARVRVRMCISPSDGALLFLLLLLLSIRKKAEIESWWTDEWMNEYRSRIHLIPMKQWCNRSLLLKIFIWKRVQMRRTTQDSWLQEKKRKKKTPSGQSMASRCNEFPL